MTAFFYLNFTGNFQKINGQYELIASDWFSKSLVKSKYWLKWNENHVENQFQPHFVSTNFKFWRLIHTYEINIRLMSWRLPKRFQKRLLLYQRNCRHSVFLKKYNKKIWTCSNSVFKSSKIKPVTQNNKNFWNPSRGTGNNIPN